jgi:hypothetical protein
MEGVYSQAVGDNILQSIRYEAVARYQVATLLSAMHATCHCTSLVLPLHFDDTMTKVYTV